MLRLPLSTVLLLLVTVHVRGTSSFAYCLSSSVVVVVGLCSSSSSPSLGNLLRGKWSLPSQVVFVKVLNDY